MPGIGIAGTSPSSPEHLDRLDRPLFKSHKSLPRKSDLAPNNNQGIHLSPDQNVRSSKGAALAPAPALPLTPPGVSQDETPTASDSEIPRGASSQSVNGIMTPSKPSHPPTPETTPPRLTPHRPAINSVGQTPSSSRAESFQTAHEMISDGETETPRRSSQSLRRPPKQRTLSNNGPLEQPSDASCGRENKKTEYHEMPAQSRREKCTEDRIPIALDPSEPPNYRHVNGPGVKAHDSLEVPRTRDSSLRERVRDSPSPDASPSMEQFRDQIGWPSGERPADRADSDDTRRHSGVSTSSTIEAMIIDSPRPTKRTLRHSEKRVSLRSASSPVTRSERSSLASNPDSHRRLVHKIARITENDRKSIASDISASGSSALGVPRQNFEVVPVVVIPERRSSLKSTPSTSRNPSKTSSSRRSSRRAPPTLSSRPGSIDAPRSKKRTVSDSSAATRPSVDSRGRSLSRPIIPPRSSSLSAPTSQNNSRTTSLTSESLRSHTQAMDREAQSKPSEPPVSAPVKDIRDPGVAPDVTNKTHSILIGVEDMSHLRPPSAPFTAISIPSSSPGPIEINEATTVVFFPHNNESLLLVDPQMQSGRHGQLPRMTYRSSLGKPQTPEMSTQDNFDSGEMGSPLKNPRRPPRPPVSSNNPSVSVDVVDPPVSETQTAQDTHDNHPQPAPRYGVRRSWRVRPRSESFNSFTRSLSLKSAKNRKSGKEIDDKLQPFWRPRQFWEDSSETEGDSPRDETPQAGRSETDQVIKNSLGMPQPRVAFEGPPISRRSPGPKRRFDGTTARRSALVGSGVFTPEALYSQTSLHQRHFRSLSWWRLRFRFGNARDFRRRLRRRLQRRAEGKREARRERLKQSIGEAVFVDSSTQTRSMIQ